MDCGQNGSMLKSLQFTKVKGGCVMSKKVVYNHKPDPVISIKEYKTDKNGELVLVEEFKPIPSDSYKLETDKSLFIIEVKKILMMKH